MPRWSTGMRIPIALLVIALACVAQTKTGKATKAEPQKKAASGYILPGTVLAKDLGCAKDYVKALAAEGVQQRKLLADLFDYGCAERVRFVYTMFSFEPQVVVPEKTSLTVWKVKGIVSQKLSELMGQSDNSTASEFNKDGWVVDADFVQLSEDAMTARIERFKKTR